MNELPSFDSLSPRERECLRFAADHTYGEIAAKLGMGTETVKTHVDAARRKLGGMERRKASRLFRESEAAPLSQGTPPQVIPASDPASAERLAPDHPIGARPDQLVLREERAIFQHPARLTPTVEASHDLTPATKILLIAIVPIAIGSLILIALAISYQIDRLLPTFFPAFHPH